MENCQCFHCYLANLTQRPDLLQLLHELYLSEQASGGRHKVKAQLTITNLPTDDLFNDFSSPVTNNDLLAIQHSLENGEFMKRIDQSGDQEA